MVDVATQVAWRFERPATKGALEDASVAVLHGRVGAIAADAGDGEDVRVKAALLRLQLQLRLVTNHRGATRRSLNTNLLFIYILDTNLATRNLQR